MRVDVLNKSVREKSPKYNADIAATDKKWTDTFSTEFQLRSEIEASKELRIEQKPIPSENLIIPNTEIDKKCNHMSETNEQKQYEGLNSKSSDNRAVQITDKLKAIL